MFPLRLKEGNYLEHFSPWYGSSGGTLKYSGSEWAFVFLLMVEPRLFDILEIRKVLKY